MIQYTLDTAAWSDLSAISQAITTLDPSAVLDLDASGRTVRIAAVLPLDELLACLDAAGAADASRHLVQLPSDCCGGCGG